MLKDESKRRLKGESRGHAGVVKGTRKRKLFPSMVTNRSTPADCCDLCRVGLQDRDNCRCETRQEGLKGYGQKNG